MESKFTCEIAFVLSRENLIKLAHPTEACARGFQDMAPVSKDLFGPSGIVVGKSSMLDFRGMAVASEMSDAVPG